MPLVLEGRSAQATAPLKVGDSQPQHRAAGSKVLEIGLLNNMPDPALRATERHFIDLLAAAAGPFTVKLHFFALPDVPRGNAAQAYLCGAYGQASDLTRSRLDGLIVTGSEPKAAALPDEPYWGSLTGVVDWAERNTLSTIFSCLAAHAAVLHLDGIVREPLASKRFGLFECLKVADDPLLEGVPAGMRIPHSRWNDLREGALRTHRYRVLTRSLEAGLDSFAKQWGSLFIFFQGHPEYAADTLMREYRRDVARYVRGEREVFPDLPVSYFDPRTESALEEAARRAAWDRLAPEGEETQQPWALRTTFIRLWRESAVQIYTNWLAHLSSLKS